MEQSLSIGNIVMRIVCDAPELQVAQPRSCRDFMTTASAAEAAGTLRIVPAGSIGSPLPAADAAVVATGFNDLGESRLYFDGVTYIIGISPCPGEEMRYMSIAGGFRRAILGLHPADRWNGFVLDSMMRIFFSQIAVLESALLIHASAVVTSRGAHLFTGRSGTGKSTHSSLWIGSFADCSLLNDDNPLVRLHSDGSVTAHGTPWSGKTACWLNQSAPLLSMTRLRQTPVNRYTPLVDVEAFVSVLPGVSVISHSRKLHGLMCATLGEVTGRAAVGILDCRPDAEAAAICRRSVESSADINN